jgi:16S rRNA (uracil1498-N3)-methyltransferase
MHRFFISPQAFANQPVVLTGDQAHQVRRVLRLRLGERVTLLDGQGYAYEAILIALGEADAKFQVVKRWKAEGEPATHITLFQAVLKGDNFTWVLQKGTEVGVSRFVPTICARNVVDDLDAAEAKRERWARIIQEAAEQCGRGRLPELAGAELFPQALAYPAAQGTLRLIAWEGERSARPHDVLAGRNLTAGPRIEVFIGPEGGFTDEEVALARRYGIQPVTLGPRILRAETAGVVAAALILGAAREM